MKRLSWFSFLLIMCLFVPITNAAKIIEVIPVSGPIGLPLIIKGENFSAGDGIEPVVTVKFGDQEATEIELLSDTEIRVITPISKTGAVDVTVNIEWNEPDESLHSQIDTLLNGFSYDGFFVFDPEKDVGRDGGVYDPDSGQNIPIQVDIPMSSLPPNDKFPSIYIKPIDRKSLFKEGFSVDRVVGELIIEMKVRDGAGNAITDFGDKIIICLSIDPDQALQPNVLLLSGPDGTLKPIKTEIRDLSTPLMTSLSPPKLIGKIKELSADGNYLTAGINHAPTTDLQIASSELQITNSGKGSEISLAGADSDDDDLTFIISELPAYGYLTTIDGQVMSSSSEAKDLNSSYVSIFSAPFTVSSDTVIYTPRREYFGNDYLKFKVSDGSLESEEKIISLEVSLPAPTLREITPAVGSTSGGTTVKFTGENFVSNTKAYFGDLEAARVMFISSEWLSVVTPPVSSADTLTVKVVNPNGKSDTLEPGIGVSTGGIDTFGFEFDDPPVVASISPESGPMDGGTSIGITGENFITGAVVYIGATEATDVTINSETSITATTAPSPPGIKDVTVETAGGTSETGVEFTYTPTPLINTVSPSRIPTSGGMELEISGENFTTDGVTVTIGGSVAQVSSLAETLIVVEAPAGSTGTADIVVTTSDAQTVTLTAGITYVETPVVTSIIPSTGPTAGGTVITITGANFVDGTTVDIGDSPATNVTFVSSTELTAITPVAQVSNLDSYVDVVVTKPSTDFTKVISGFGYIAPPVVTSVEPNEASIEGGTPLTITGGNFDDDATVTIGGIAATNVQVVSATEITVTTPTVDLSADEVVDLVVTNSDGQSDSTSFTYIVPPPSLVSVSPSVVTTAGGTTITIKGSAFVSGIAVAIDGTTIDDVTFISANEIQVQTPAHAAGMVDLLVTNPDAQTGELADTINYVDKPFIVSLTPSEGTTSGGTSVTIIGSNFDNNATVTIGGQVAQVSNLAETEITVTTPATPFTREKTVEGGEFGDTIIEVPTGGFADVVVENPDSGFVATLVGGFNYLVPPEIASVEPGSSTTLGGQLIVITGDNFNSDGGLSPTVTIDGKVGQTVSFSTTQIDATVPASDQNEDQTVDLVVTNSDGLSATTSFNYEAPTPVIASVSPSIVTTAGGSTVTIKGNNFLEELTVKIDEIAIDNVTFVSNEEIQVQTVAHDAGLVDVEVTNPGDRSGSLAEALNFVDKPFIVEVTPGSGSISGGTTITITGTNFASDATVTLGGQVSNSSYVSETELTATTPSDSAGFVDVVVENVSTGLKATLTGGFNYLTPPQIDSITPDSGSVLGGQLIIVAGENFEDGATLSIGGNVAQISNSASTEISATTPAISAGTYDVVVQNPSGLDDTLVEGFEYVTPAPTINSVSPKDGPTAGGISITISGINFFDGATVTIGGNDATDIEVTSSSQISVTLPDGTAINDGAGGTVDVVVTNPDSQSDTITGGFTYTVKTPTITAISPDSGSTTGGTSISITGEHFLPDVTVTIGGDAALDVDVVSVSEINATTPAGSAGTADVVVTHTDWDSPVTRSDGFTYIALPPAIDSIDPTIGPVAGGTSITLSGSCFVDNAVVTIGGQVGQTVSLSSTKITITTPAGSGTVDVVITNPDAQSNTLTDGFSYIPVPTVTAIAPDIGPTSGNTSFTITGTNFVDGAVVTIGGNVVQIANLSTTKIYAKTPAGTAGTANIVITNPASQSDTLSAGFTYIPVPSITGILPDSGPIVGGTAITITGENFVDGATVTIDGRSATDVELGSSTSITAKTPAFNTQHASRRTTVVVTNPASQSFSLTDGFTYISPPTVSSILPTSGPEPGGTPVTITGTNFQDGAVVTIGGNVAQISNLAATEITAITPAGSGTVDIVVENPDSQSGTLDDGFTYIQPPTVDSISPTSGPEDGDTAITITGTNFQDGATVTIDGTDATNVVFVSETEITAITPPAVIPQGHDATFVDVVVENPDSQSGTLTDGFSYIPPPTVTSISPTSAPEPGGTPVTITGTNFQDGAVVTIGGNVAQISNLAETEITAATPPAPDLSQALVDSVDVVVTNPDTQSDTLEDGFAYDPPPTVTAISPSRSAIAGGIDVVIAGKNFVDGATVTIDGTAVDNLVFVSATQFTATAPPFDTQHAEHNTAVIVENPDSQSDTLADAFSYIPPPTVTSISPDSGPKSGDTKITITGENFVYGTTVTIGGTNAIDLVVNSSTNITAKTPETPAGIVDVVVTDPVSQSDSLSNAFEYLNIVQKSVKTDRAQQFSIFDLELQIPVGAVTENKMLEAKLATDLPGFLSGMQDLSKAYELYFVGDTESTTFDPLSTLTFSYQDEQLPGNVDEGSFRIYWLEDGLWKYVGGTVDADNNTVSAEIEHFSTYRLLAGYAYGDVSGSGDIDSLDAALVLQKAVELIEELPPDDRPAFRPQTGDVSGNGVISAFDSALILRKSVELPPDPNYPDRQTFPVEETTQAVPPSLLMPSQQASIKVKEAGEEVQIEINLDNVLGWEKPVLSEAEGSGFSNEVRERATAVTQDIIAVDLQWTYDPQEFRIISVTPAVGNAMTNINTDIGHLKVSIASMDKLSSASPLLTIKMHSKKFGHHLDQNLSDIKIQLNENPTLIGVKVARPETTLLLQNYPNPFNPETWIPYQLKSESSVKIELYNSTGQLIRILDLGVKPVGLYISKDQAVHWDGKNDFGEKVGSGLYFYNLIAGDYSAVKKMVILK